MKFYASTSSKLVTKLAGSMAIGSMLLAGSVSAQAMLPTPEPEMSSPSNQANAAAMQATQANQVVSKTVAALVSVDAQGQPTLKPIDANTRLQKGNVIEYHSYFTNTGKDRMRKMDVTMTIPEEVKLVGQVSPDTASASIDGTNFSHMPLRGSINGQMQDVPLEYYKNLRWTIEGLGINETAVVKYRAIVK
ncbi:hypothetical protein DLE54_10825 [Psychrobacter sp. YP14]|uniref:DUF11 domain-containing protein n=3 Tax=Psychrobacter TaxID=497 RepID=A0A844M1E2_9GAMM|nr:MULTISPECIES: hypothetical protein [Psychrobacter]AWT49949.1 hypothetical protein DLE54_10825 [Psychrobacter sp. YP14]MUG32752.1 hypothetical protein [Psychrobacter sanguinis]